MFTELALQLTGMLGIANMQQDNSSYNLTSNETHQLVQTDTQSWDAWSLQLGAGFDVPLSDDRKWLTKVTPQINYYILNNAQLDGEVYRFEDIDDNDAAYNMNFNSTRLMFDTALTIYELRKLSFYGIAGLGIAWTDLTLALEPYPDSHLEPLHFNSGEDSGFAYEFGAGVTYELNDELDIALQYLYTGFSDVAITGQDDIFTVTDSNINVSSQSLLLGFNLSV